MSNVLRQIQDEASLLKLDDSLLFLNRLLAVSRKQVSDPQLERCFLSQKVPFPAFPVHFIAKQLLLHASNLGPNILNPSRFKRLLDLFFELDDPIVGDPEWKHADPTGFFERLLSQQLPAQRRNMIQKFGLALGLFRDVGPIRWPLEYDLRADLEKELGISVEEFMMMGFVAFALRITTNPGTFTPAYLAEAFRQGIKVAAPEIWSKFLPRVSCDRDCFRKECQRDIYQATDSRYVTFEFNPLHRFPVIDVGGGRYLAVDPELVIDRTTLGLFYDLFERSGLDFAVRFGYAFEAFVGKLLRSACPANAVWSASEWESSDVERKKRETGKKGDWAYIGASHNVLFECKSLRPSLELTMCGSQKAVQAMQERISKALTQLIGHNEAIQRGEWREQGLVPRPTVCVVVTYGRFQTSNTSFVRKRVRQQLATTGLDVPPFVVLSLVELDIVMRLVELGHPLDEVVLALSNEENSFDPLQRYHSELTTRAVSSYAYDAGEAFMERITPEDGSGE